MQEKTVSFEAVFEKAYAKINLGLDVLGKREDGYHELRMIMQTLSLHDLVRLQIRAGSGIFLETDDKAVPGGPDNLAFKAAALMLDRYRQEGREGEWGIDIRLEKRIPMAAGLAGGSSDAAAVLRGMNTLLGLGYSAERLRQLGVQLGADVPYCVTGGTALAEGIGEKLTLLPAPPPCQVVLVRPNVAVSTAYVYTHLDLGSVTHHPEIDAQVRALQEGDLQSAALLCENVLETVTGREYPQMEQLKRRLKECGAVSAMMSGSGPTVFGLFIGENEKEKADEAAQVLRQEGEWQVIETALHNEKHM